jgi:single-strand DNA-binding protein
MASVNKVILVGRLGKDPEVKSIPSGTTVVKFSVATDEKFTNRNGEKQERTEWHNIEVWGKLGEICAQYLRKGKLVYLEGSIRTEEYEKDGEKKRWTKIVANEMRMLDRRGDEDEGGSYSGGGERSYANSAPRRGNAPAPAVDDDEEVPF